MEAARLRQFAGTANTWIYRTVPDDGRRYARSVPGEALDFSPLPGIRDEGWPVDLDALRPHYERAQRMWNGSAFDYDIGRWSDDDAQPIQSPGGVLATRISQHGPRDVFALRYRDELLAADNVQLLTGATATKLDSDPPGRVQRLDVGLTDGGRIEVRAAAFVLACGGIENAQLLLASPLGEPGAAGNRHDNVGRYLTDHQEFRMGTISSDPGIRDALALYDLRWVGPFLVSGFVTINEEAKRTEGLLNVSAALVMHGPEFGSAAHHGLASLLHLQHRERPDALLRSLGSLVASPRDTVGLVRSRHSRYQEWSGGWSRPTVDRNRLPMIEIHAATEQTPDRENRVTLGADRDALGRRRAAVHWRWSQVDRDNIERSIGILAHEFDRSGLGRFARWGSLDRAERPRFPGFFHPMGTTRMHADPELGAVDVDCRLHGTENVYLAGSSVFPTGLGYANPTLTILALAVRLADHLKATLGENARS